MKRFLKLFLVVLSVIFTMQVSRADDNYRVLVLPDNIQFDSTNYYIYPDSSIMFASDTINEIKKDGRITTVSMTEVRDTLRKNTKLSILTRRALKEFKYNYNIPFVDFKAIAQCFSTNKVLVITSQTDVQNYFLRRSVCDFFNIPGTAVVDPAYKLATYAVLIDVDKEQVLWQNTYYKTISSLAARILPNNFAPATEQLEKLKSYSTYMLSPHIASMVATNVLPPPIILPNGKIMNISSKRNSSGQNLNEMIMPSREETDLKPKTIIHSRKNNQNYGATLNDL
jgi:hypothetical protein